MPENSDIKVIDFGSATFDDQYHSSIVSTRHYRAPEVILGLGWTFPCDIWSVGCILAELLYRKPLFPGKDYIHQLKLIIKTLGSPSDEDLEFISIPKARAFIKAMPRVQVRVALHLHSHPVLGQLVGLDGTCSSTLPTSWRTCQQSLTMLPAGCLAHAQAVAAASC